MIEVNDLLIKAGADPARTIAMRHRPFEPGLRRVISWIAAEEEALFIAYQATQGPRVEKAMTRAGHVFSCIGTEAGTAVFVALYAIEGWSELAVCDYWSVPEYARLGEYGLSGFREDDPREIVLKFNLVPSPALAAYANRLTIGWPGLERAWYRWADRNVFPVLGISPRRVVDQEMPDWTELVLEWRELAALPESWAVRLAEWRGIYLITDLSDAKQYVGSAYGAENILGRWCNYAATGHGNNRLLRGRDPRNFRFSILQRLSPDLDPDEVIRIESGWKTRLMTRELGLNAN